MADRHGERPPVRKRDRSQRPTAHDRKRLERALARVGLGVPDPDAAEPGEPGETTGDPMSTKTPYESDDGPMGRMIIEIGNGVAIADSLVVRTPADAAIWDELVAYYAEAKANGWLVVLDIDWPGPADPVWWSDPPVEPPD